MRLKKNSLSAAILAAALSPLAANAGYIQTKPTGANNKSEAGSMAVQADGKVLLAGYAVKNLSTQELFTLVRYNAGTDVVDSTFGVGGTVTLDTQFGARNARIHKVLVGTANLYAVGEVWDSLTESKLAIARFDANGALDATFGTGGVLELDAGLGIDKPYAAALDATTGSVYVAGSNNAGGWVKRITAAGAEDATFVATLPAGFVPYAALTNGASVVLGGTDGTNMALVRLDTVGALDAAFGTAGVVATPVASGLITMNGVVRDMAYDAAGNIVVAGTASVAGVEGAAVVARYTAAGAADTTFATTGMTLSTVVSGGAYALTITPTGTILVAGTGLVPNTTTATNTGLRVAAYNNLGGPVTTFGNSGAVTYDVNSAAADKATGIAVDASGKILLGGTGGTGTPPQAIVPQFTLGRLTATGADDYQSGAFTANFVNTTTTGLPGGGTTVGGGTNNGCGGGDDDDGYEGHDGDDDWDKLGERDDDGCYGGGDDDGEGLGGLGAFGGSSLFGLAALGALFRRRRNG